VSLRHSIARAGHLLETSSQFYRGWELRLGALCSGYTATGKPAPLARSGRLVVQV
jgi:hypothetical protein